MGTLFPMFFVSEETIAMQVGAALARRRASRAAFPRGARRACASSTACAPSRDGGAMGIPFSYIARNLVARRLTTVLTAGGMALVVYVFATVLMLAAGLRETLVATGPARQRRRDPARGADRGAERHRPRCRPRIVESLPDIATGEDGERLISKEPVVLINLPKRETGKPSNVVDPRRDAGGPRRCGRRCGSSRAGCSGRARRRSIAGRAIADGFRGAGVGETLRFALRDWTVVGVFDAGRTGFDSEIWGDAEQMLQAFRRRGFSSLIFRLADADRFDAVKREIESDPRLTLEAKRETQLLRRPVRGAAEVHLATSARRSRSSSRSARSSAR